ncbi:MAG TPA: recombinase RecT, partial [Gemmatimonadaceae bacterium]|nr:recombinase RecT [Gemmatimonadaceae bacterium]
MNLPAQTDNAIRDLRGVLNSDAMKKQIKMALPSILPLDRFLRTFFTTVNKTPDLALCDRDSVMAGVMTAASLGLEIDPSLGRAYLIPFKDRRKGLVAQFIIGYKGYIDLFYRSGMAAGLVAEAVYEKDEFEFELGLEPKLVHRPSEDEDRGRLKFAYAIAFLENGGKVWRVLNRSAVMRAKASSRGAESEYSPWNTSEEQMWVK